MAQFPTDYDTFVGTGSLLEAIIRRIGKSGETDPTSLESKVNGTGDISGNARVGVRKNSAGSTFKRRRLNLIEGTNVTLTVADDSTDEEVDVTIAGPAYATPVAIGNANAAGSAATAAKSDHVHNGLVQGAQTADVTTSETTTSAAYADLATAGPSVTVAIGASGMALVIISTRVSNTGANLNSASLSVDGSAPSDADAAASQTGASVVTTPSKPILVTGLSPANHTFKVQYKTSGGTATFSQRRIVVIPL